ncbi:MAG: chemotaxis protein CheA [Gammaproteobacteria bacterium]|nr:chemotaxis protein CheA [Gammaproteobacteria bacterium]
MSEIELSQLPDFIVEATEHLEEMETLLLQLVESPDDLEILNELFRPVHTIKGSAQFIGIKRISELTHRLEDLMDKLRDATMVATPFIIETLIEARDRIIQLVKELERTQTEESSVDDLLDKLSSILDGTALEGTSEFTQQDITKTTAMTSLDASLKSQNNDLSEENDEELLSIYLNQVNTQSSVIKGALDNIDNSEDKQQRLTSCFDAIEKLRLSANYMGYEEIAEFCSGWAETIQQALKELTKGKEISLSFMEFYFAELMQFYPQLKQDKDTETNPQSTESADISPDSDMPKEVKKSISGVGIQEENDEELFSIFTKQLQDSVSALEKMFQEPSDTVNNASHIQSTIGIIDKLTSSANYMGYEEVSEFYAGWSETLTQAAKAYAKGDEVSLSFMDFYLAELKQLFPDVAFVSTTDNELQKTPAPVITDDIPVPSTDASAIDELSAALDESINSQIDDALFGQLSTALSQPIHEVTKAEYETLNQVYDVMVSSATKETNTATQVQQTPAKKPLKQVVPERRTYADRRVISEERRLFEERRSQRENKENKTKRSLRVDSDKIDTLMNQVGELVVDRSYFVQLQNELSTLQRYLKESLNLDQKELKMLRTFNYRLGEAISGLGRTSNELQEGVMKMRMLPISQIFNRYPRLVHDLTHNSAKKVNLIVKGEETELDKMIVEELSDPLVHIIRNAVDHGIETMDERKLLGKQAEANLMLNAYQESNNIVIEVTDDGRGLDHQKIKSKAIEKGLFSADELERMSAPDINKIILTAGFSTAGKVSSTSGRGVGMDVVRKNIEKLNGSLVIDTKPGAGTRMRVKIPLTLAIIHALMIRTGNDVFAIPLANVDESVRINVEEISTVEGVEVIYLRGQTLPVFRLSHIFNIDSDANTNKLYVVIVSSGGQRVGFVVDEMMGQDEVVIKPLVDYVQDKSGFSGATIIGDGRISLILDVYELVRLTAERQAKKQREQTRRLKENLRKKLKSE